MKNNKIAFLAPILVVVCAVGILLIRTSYSASDTAKVPNAKEFYYIRRNMFSHYYINHNSKEDDGVMTASGTILIKSGKNRSSSTQGEAVAVYCAEQNQGNKPSSHTRISLATAKKDGYISDLAKNVLNVMLKYSYPYITLSSVKEALKNETYGIGDDYTKYNFDNLTAQEAMTATQASIWNAIKKKNDFYFNYGGKLKAISKYQIKFTAPNMKITWDTCGSYKTGSNNFATILTSEEEKWYGDSGCDKSGEFYKNVFELKEDGKVKDRINTLVKWYANLYTKVSSEDIPEIAVKSSSFALSDGKLTATVTLTSEGKDYSVEFTDKNGKSVLAKQSVKGNSSGNTFVIDDLPLDTTTLNAKITISRALKSVYYYQGGGQDWIGVSSGDYNEDIPIFNTGNGEIIVYKVGNQALNVDVSYNSNHTEDNKCSTYGGCLEDAEFILYADDKTTVVKRFVSNGEPFSIKELADGTYYLYEQEAPYGYTKYKITGSNVDSDGYIKIVISNGNMASVVVNNNAIKVCFKKVDSVTKKVIDGAKLRVEDAEGSVFEVFTSSSQQGQYCLLDGQIPSGYYYITEEETPVGFRKPEKVFGFLVGDFTEEDIVVDYDDSDIEKLTNNNNVVTIENKPSTVITKSDLATGECVEGAHLVVKDEKGNQVDEWTSTCEDGNDSHTLELSEGKYTLTEELTPSGYATAESIEFEVSSDGKVSTSLDMKDAPINACFMKVSGSKEGIAGAEFTIYDSNNQEYKKFTSTDGEVCFQYMPVGKYKIRETNAPEGYEKLEEDIEIEVKDTNETQRFKINNEAIANKTSQDSSQLVIIIASIFMLVGLGLVGYYGYKKQS